jgi:hypothetical protein
MGHVMKDYRFDFLAYGLRKENRKTYAFSTAATKLLAENDETSRGYGDEMWEEFWLELVMEYESENK